MDTFTPVSGFLGGALIGLASILLLLANGRIAGISGILGGVLAPIRGDVAWRALFIIGLWLGALIYSFARGGLAVELQSGWPVMIVAGLLVGFGTRMGGGCTSGHAVCGIARSSMRSIVATLVFMGSAILTVYVTRHLMQLGGTS